VCLRDCRPIWRDLVNDEAVGLGAEDLEGFVGDLRDRDVLPSLVAAHSDRGVGLKSKRRRKVKRVKSQELVAVVALFASLMIRRETKRPPPMRPFICWRI